jgi:hypothetical protein
MTSQPPTASTRPSGGLATVHSIGVVEVASPSNKDEVASVDSFIREDEDGVSDDEFDQY